MDRLFKQFLNICLLRAAPQDLPASSFLLVLCGVLGLATGTLVIRESFASLSDAVMAQLLDLALVLLLLHQGLQYTRRPARFLQSATSLLGTGIVVNLAMLPLLWLLDGAPRGSLQAELGSFAYFLLLLWTLVVIGHILRHTFSIRLRSGFFIALGYFILVNWLVQLLFPVGG